LYDCRIGFIILRHIIVVFLIKLINICFNLKIILIYKIRYILIWRRLLQETEPVRSEVDKVD
jgi:hypothetical protein